MSARTPTKLRRDPGASRPGRAAQAGQDAPADETPRNQRARDRAVLAATLDPIVTIDFAGTIQSASDSIERVLGWTPTEVIGRNVSILMPEPHHSAHDGYLADYHRTGRTRILNQPRRLEALHKDGSLVPIELCVSRADVPNGGAPLFVGLIRDMSAFIAAERSREEERLHARQQLAEQTSALQQAHLRLRTADRMASIGTLAAGLGHDMNNVLMPVRARLNALKASGEAGNLPRTDTRHVQEIQKSVAYLQQLADGLHFLALDPDADEDTRGGGGATDLGHWWAQAGPLLSKAVPKHVRVSASFAADLPHVAVAAHRLTQAVLNLVVNAGEATRALSGRKRRPAQVRIWAERLESGADGWIHLGVTDNGSGMSDDVRRRAFEMFFTTKPRGLGTGLGLALVRKVVEGAGGRVEIQSEVGTGTTVRMVLPVVPAMESSGAAGGRPAAAISVRDGRAAALIRHLLESGGADVRGDGVPADADIWVVDPATTHPDEAAAWRRRTPRGRLVLFGRPDPPSTAAWGSLRPLTIEAPDDFAAVRAAITRAVSPT